MLVVVVALFFGVLRFVPAEPQSELAMYTSYSILPGVFFFTNFFPMCLSIYIVHYWHLSNMLDSTPTMATATSIIAVTSTGTSFLVSRRV